MSIKSHNRPSDLFYAKVGLTYPGELEIALFLVLSVEAVPSQRTQIALQERGLQTSVKYFLVVALSY